MLSSEVFTRPARESDVAKITDLTRSLWLEQAAKASDLQDLPKIEFFDFEQYVAGTMVAERHKWFVAEAGHKVVGSVHSEVVGPRNALYVHDKLLRVDDIAVDSNYRRRGVAANLIQVCKQYAASNDIKLLQATVYDWNEGSVDLFAGLGFRPTRTDFFAVLDK